MRISLHRGVSNTQAASEAELPQEASTTLWDVLHHPALREREDLSDGSAETSTVDTKASGCVTVQNEQHRVIAAHLYVRLEVEQVDLLPVAAI